MKKFSVPKPGTFGPKFGTVRLNPGSGRIMTYKDKSLGQTQLPNRAALNQLTKGSPVQRSINNYAKMSPAGEGSILSYNDIMNMGRNAADATPSEDDGASG